MLFRLFQQTEELRIERLQIAACGQEGRNTVDDRVKSLAALAAIRLICLRQRARTLRTGKNILPVF